MPSYLHRNQVPPKGQQIPKQDIPRKFSSKNTPLSFSIQAAQSYSKPLMSHNPLLVTPLHSREKKPSSTHQNSNTSLPNQETSTSH